MYKNLVFIKPINKEKEIIDKFNLTEIFKNDRTHIFENKEMRMSFDETVIRVMVFKGENKKLIESIENYFYEEEN